MGTYSLSPGFGSSSIRFKVPPTNGTKVPWQILSVMLDQMVIIICPLGKNHSMIIELYTRFHKSLCIDLIKPQSNKKCDLMITFSKMTCIIFFKKTTFLRIYLGCERLTASKLTRYKVYICLAAINSVIVMCCSLEIQKKKNELDVYI